MSQTPTSENSSREEGGHCTCHRDHRVKNSPPRLYLEKNTNAKDGLKASVAFWHQEHQEHMGLLLQILQEMRELNEKLERDPQPLVRRHGQQLFLKLTTEKRTAERGHSTCGSSFGSIPSPATPQAMEAWEQDVVDQYME